MQTLVCASRLHGRLCVAKAPAAGGQSRPHRLLEFRKQLAGRKIVPGALMGSGGARKTLQQIRAAADENKWDHLQGKKVRLFNNASRVVNIMP